MNTASARIFRALLCLAPLWAATALRAQGAPDQPQVRQLIIEQPQAAMIGMAIDMRPQTGDAGDGVRVLNVSPGGPAAMAGLQANDVVLSFAGQALRASGDVTAARQLTDAIAATRPGTPVALEYRREGRVVKTQVTPVPRNGPRPLQLSDVPGWPELRDLGQRLDDRLVMLGRRNLGPFGAIELTELTPTLGRYFGTGTGLLVVRAPQDGRLKLEDGDVILDIDGRVPGNAGHALQILGSYQAGETIKLHVMRQQKRMELVTEVPAPAEPRALRQPQLPPQPPRPPQPQRGAGPAGTSL